MRSRKSVVKLLGLLIAIIATGYFLFVLPHCTDIRSTQNQPSPAGNQNSRGLDTRNAARKLDRPHTDPFDAIPVDQRAALIAEKLKKLTATQQAMDRDIAFYGKIVDQTGAPIPDVVVIGTVGYFGEVYTGGNVLHKTVAVTSDREGRFSITGYSGLHLDIAVSRDGYYFRRMPVFDYRDRPGPYANPETPFLISGYKLSAGYPDLIMGHIHFKFVPDGRWYTLDLVKKDIDEGATDGDIQISVKRSFNGNELPVSHRYDWDLTLRVNGGGLLEIERPTYTAPSDGYLSEWHFVMIKDDPRWDTGINKHFYLKSREGQVYARGNIDIDVFRPDTGLAKITLTYWLNKDGSKNLFSITDYPEILNK